MSGLVGRRHAPLLSGARRAALWLSITGRCGFAPMAQFARDVLKSTTSSSADFALLSWKIASASLAIAP